MKFDAEEFFKEKDIRIIADEIWHDYTDNKITKTLGTKYKCIIAFDNTKYEGDDVAAGLNSGEPLSIKIGKERIDYKKFSKIKLINPTATVYGQFQSELSVKAEDYSNRST